MPAPPSVEVPARASARLRAFAERGRHTSYDGHSVFVVDSGPVEGSARAPVLFVHGFPGAAFDFADAMAIVEGERRVIALDLLGYGLSDKPLAMGLSLFEQADVIEVVLASLGVPRVHVVAHDMGTTVALELLARRRLGLLSFAVSSVLFTNGSVFIEMSQLTPSQRLLRVPGLGNAFARIASFATFRFQIDRITGRALSEEAARDMFELMTLHGGRQLLPKLIGYIEERHRFAERWVGHLGAVDLPVTVLWGQRDPVAVASIGERLAAAIPRAELVRLDDVGHFSPIEAPAELAEAIGRLAARAE